MKIMIAVATLFLSVICSAEVIRHPLPNNSTFPIAQAVEVPAGNTLIYLSGTVPSPIDREAKPETREYYGDTEAQTLNVLGKMQATLKGMDLDLGDVVKLTVFLVGDPENNNRMDFSGFMKGYTQFFGTEDQPNLPARSAFQIAGLTQELMFVEIEAVVVRSK